MSLDIARSIAVSSLMASQVQISVASSNVSNADTTGYTVKTAAQVSRRGILAVRHHALRQVRPRHLPLYRAGALRDGAAGYRLMISSYVARNAWLRLHDTHTEKLQSLRRQFRREKCGKHVYTPLARCTRGAHIAFQLTDITELSLQSIIGKFDLARATEL